MVDLTRRQADNSVMEVGPIQSLAAAITKRLVLTVERNVAARTDGKSNEFTIKE